MGIITGVVALGFLLLMGVVVYSLFSETIDTIISKINEEQEKQNVQAPPDERENGNLASNTGTRVCDLDIKIVGVVYDSLPLGIGDPFTGQELGLWVGDVTGKADTSFFFEDYNKNVIEYQWICASTDTLPSTASLLDMLSFYNKGTLEQLSLFQSSTVEVDKTILLYLEAESMNSKRGEGVMYAYESSSDRNNLEDRKNVFSGYADVYQDTKLPQLFEINMRLYDVTEDDYDVKFWSKDMKLNEKIPNVKYKYNLCSPSKSSCG